MPLSPALCPACSRELPFDFINRPAAEPCPFCQNKVQAAVYPALFRKKSSNLPVTQKKEGEAACFYHPDKPAVAVCDFCGVFLSDLCDLHINDKHICPPCFSKPENKSQLIQSDRTRTLYDGIALALAVISLCVFALLSPFFIFSLFTSMASIFIALRYWKSPGSIIPRSKIRYILAIFFASLQLLAWVGMVVFFIYAISSSLNKP